MSKSKNRGLQKKTISVSYIALAMMIASAVQAQEPSESTDPHLASAKIGFVKRDGNRLTLNGHPYRAIGVNIPNMSQVYMGVWGPSNRTYGSQENAKKAIIEAIEDAGRNGFAFVRFFANPGYPIDLDRIYFSDRAKYWALMDEVIGICRKNNLRVAPSLGAAPGSFAEYCGERKQAILDPQSKTHHAAYAYIREFVTRYKDDPSVLMWEIQNEMMSKADVDFTGKPAPPAGLFTSKQQPYATLALEDSLTWAMILKIRREQALFIQQIDPNHLVTSGDAHVRYECTSRRETFPKFKFRDDTFEEWVANNIQSQPAPLDLLSYHLAATADPKPRWGMQTMVWLKKFLNATSVCDQPVYVGELGQDRPSYKDEPTAGPARELIDIAEEAGVSLMALWVWHFPYQQERSVSSRTHPELVKRCAEFNLKYAR